MIKKLEIIGISILIIIGLIWGGGEIYLRNFADKNKLEVLTQKYLEKKQFFYASILARCAYKAGSKEAAIILMSLSFANRNPHSAKYWSAQIPKSLKSEKEASITIDMVIAIQSKELEKACKLFNSLRTDFKDQIPEGIQELIREKIYDFTIEINDFQKYADQGNKNAFPILACLYIGHKDKQNAEKYLTMAFENNDEWATYKLLSIAKENNDEQLTVKILNRLIAIDDKYHNRYGAYYLEKKEFVKALEHYKKFYSANHVYGARNVCRVYILMNNFDEGIKYFKKLYENDKNRCEEIARLYEAQKNYNEARKWWKITLKKRPGYIFAINSLNACEKAIKKISKFNLIISEKIEEELKKKEKTK
ncbi:hypothetical protein AAEX28_09415 [Lentisphaerota bacterium WC36G]|nr:hypothetical protein LJT99_12255 [Lentisphaerae bacterium WC36]